MSTIARIVLVGLPGAGKSTVGAMVAERLGWRFVDLDAAIERTAGRSVPEIFAREGETGFRARERLATQELAASPHTVISPGAGWMVDPVNREILGTGTVVVHLAVSPVVAAARLADAPGSRPLLAGGDPVRALENLLVAREATYLQANHTVTVDSMTPDEVASIIVALA